MKHLKYVIALSLVAGNASAVETLIPNKENALLFGGRFQHDSFIARETLSKKHEKIEILQKENIVTELVYLNPLDEVIKSIKKAAVMPKSATPSLADTLATLSPQEEQEGVAEENEEETATATPLMTFVDSIDDIDFKWLIERQAYEAKSLLNDIEDIRDSFYAVEYFDSDELPDDKRMREIFAKQAEESWERCENSVNLWNKRFDHGMNAYKPAIYEYVVAEAYVGRQPNCSYKVPHVSYVDIDLDNDGVNERVINVMNLLYYNSNVKFDWPVNILNVYDKETQMITSPSFFYKKDSEGEWELFYQSAVRPSYIYDDGTSRSLMFLQPSFGMSVNIADIM